MEKIIRSSAIEKFSSIPRLEFGHYPTPVEELVRLRRALTEETGSCPRIFIKRDDYAGPGFGGNKVRKMEYILHKAARDSVEIVITSGGVKSNHARITAAMCARAGIRCILVLNRAAVMYEGLCPASLHLDKLYGAEIVRVEDRDDRDPKAEEIAEKLTKEGRKVCVVPLGASIPLGALGTMRAIEEAKSQTELKGLRIDHLFHCSSSGGTQAGLEAGLQLFDWETVRITGVSPDETSETIGKDVAGIIRGIGEMLEMPPDTLNEEVTVDDKFIGEGYGIPTPESQRAIELIAHTEGIILDPVYTAKAMACLLYRIKQGLIPADENVLFWHTGGQLALFYVPEDN